MTLLPARLLVSVRNAKEAEDALLGGADIIDVKEPNHGSLGRATAESICSVLKAVRQSVPVTVAMGELSEGNLTRDIPDGVFAAKFGLAGALALNTTLSDGHPNITWQHAWQTRWSNWNGNRVAVAYADYHKSMSPLPQEVALAALDVSCTYLLIDTFEKTASLRELLDASELAHELDAAIEIARASRMQLVIAGSVAQSDFAYFADRWGPHIFAVRGAACAGDRTASICRSRVEQLKQALANTYVPPTKVSSSDA